MKARWTLVGLAAGALTLGLLAPVAASGAPAADTTAAPVAVKPDGQALIYIAGGTARAEKTGRLRYRIVIPAGPEISWLGMRGGEGRVGTFTPKALVAAWLGMGYRDGKKAVATLSWGDTGEKRRANHVLAVLQAPRLTKDGSLVFQARTIVKQLPQALKDLDVNVSRASRPQMPSTRVEPPPNSDDSWTRTFAPIAIDANGTAAVQAVVSNDSVADVLWPATTDPNPCRGPVETSVSHTNTIFPGFPCGDGTVNSKIPMVVGREQYNTYEDSNVNFTATTQAIDGVTGEVVVTLGYTPTGGGEFLFTQIVALWDKRGNDLMPRS